jgi:type VI secretion system secreted protein Hcp
MLKTILSHGRRSHVLGIVFCAAAVAAAGAVARADTSNDQGNGQDTISSSSNALRDLRELLASQTFVATPPQPIGTIALDDAVFEIHDFSFGVENPGTSGTATGGAGAGKVTFNEFKIKRSGDVASPRFFNNCVTGTHFKKATLQVRKAGSSGGTFLVYTFGTVLVTKMDWSGPGDQGPEESITFNFSTVELSTQSDESGVTTSGVFNTTQ